jgi:hypothetical protein
MLLPKIESQNALLRGIPKDKAKGMAPLNSAMGKVATIMTMYSLGKSLSQQTIASNNSSPSVPASGDQHLPGDYA